MLLWKCISPLLEIFLAYFNSYVTGNLKKTCSPLLRNVQCYFTLIIKCYKTCKAKLSLFVVVVFSYVVHKKDKY